MEEVKMDPIENLKGEIEKIKNKEFNIYFFVADTKGTPSGYITYIYETAKALKGLGYNVHMLHQESEFMGMSSWYGDRFEDIQHHNIEKDNINISASDFLIIPELFSNVMSKTTKVPCKRIVILQNYNFMTQVIPAGATWGDYGIRDCVCNTQRMSDIVKSSFQHVTTRIVPPMVDDNLFKVKNNAKQLIVNVVSRNQEDVNKIVKSFFWKYPMYRWVAFRDLRGMEKEDFLSALHESAITVWVDRDTDFGYSALEALKCGNLLIGCVPNNIPSWMLDEEGNLNNKGVWYYNDEDVHALIAGAIESFLMDSIHPTLIDGINSVDDLFNENEFIENVKKVYVDDIFEKHRLSLTIALNALENNKLTNNEE